MIIDLAPSSVLASRDHTRDLHRVCDEGCRQRDDLRVRRIRMWGRGKPGAWLEIRQGHPYAGQDAKRIIKAAKNDRCLWILDNGIHIEGDRMRHI